MRVFTGRGSGFTVLDRNLVAASAYEMMCVTVRRSRVLNTWFDVKMHQKLGIFHITRPTHLCQALEQVFSHFQYKACEKHTDTGNITGQFKTKSPVYQETLDIRNDTSIFSQGVA